MLSPCHGGRATARGRAWLRRWPGRSVRDCRWIGSGRADGARRWLRRCALRWVSEGHRSARRGAGGARSAEFEPDRRADRCGRAERNG